MASISEGQGVHIYHDVGLDRQELHDRYAAWCDENWRYFPRAQFHSYSFEQADGTYIHTLLVVKIDEALGANEDISA